MRLFAIAAALLCDSGAYAQDLSGWYAGLSGAAGTSSSLQFDSFALKPTTDRLGGFVGYDAYYGDWLLGVEGSLETEINRSRRFEEVVLPVGGVTTISYDLSSSYREIAAPTLSIRLGRRFGQFLAYGRVGAGLAVVDVANDSGTGCTLVGPNGYIAGCDVAGVKMDFSETRILPTANVGLGLQYDFGRAFVRSEFQLRQVFTNDADWTFTNHATQALGSFAIGMRF